MCTFDEATSTDLHKIMMEEDKQLTESFPPESFRSLFWQQQRDALQSKSKGKRWHPLMIRWCLYIRHQSGKASKHFVTQDVYSYHSNAPFVIIHIASKLVLDIPQEKIVS